MHSGAGGDGRDAAHARARLLYTRSPVPLDIVAASLGLSCPTLRRRMPGWGWPARRGAGSGDGPTEGRLPGEAMPAGRREEDGPDRRATARAIERFVADRIVFHEAEVRAGRDSDPERTARAIGHYVRALGAVRAYSAEPETHDPAPEPEAAPPRSLGELRDELSRHLQRLRDEERSRRRNRRARPDAAGN